MANKTVTITKPNDTSVAKEKKFFVELVVRGEIPADGFSMFGEVSSLEEAAEEAMSLLRGCEWDLELFSNEFSFGEDAILSLTITELEP